MSNQTIPQLNDVVTVTATVLFEISMGGVTYKMSDAEFVAWLQTSFGMPSSLTPTLPAATGQDITLNNNANTAKLIIQHGGTVEIEVANGQNLLLANLPTANPHVVNAVWNNSGALELSAG